MEAEGRPTETAPAVAAIAKAALRLLSNEGRLLNSDAVPSDRTWLVSRTMGDGVTLKLCCTGPDLPADIPDRTVFPADIPKEPQWVASYRLVVAAPIVAFDICWRPGEPLRIMTFSRGDWEQELLG